MKRKVYDTNQPKEVKRMIAERDKKEKQIIMTAYKAAGVEELKDVTVEVNGDVKAFTFNGQVFMILNSIFVGGSIHFDIQATKSVLIALKLQKLIS